MAQKDLKPVQSKEEAIERGRKGGIASGKVRKAKKNIKQQFEFAIDIYTKKALKDPNLTEEQKKILTETNIIVLDMMKTALNGKVKTETRLKAKDMILDRVHGKSKQEVESKFSGDVKISWED